MAAIRQDIVSSGITSLSDGSEESVSPVTPSSTTAAGAPIMSPTVSLTTGTDGLSADTLAMCSSTAELAMVTSAGAMYVSSTAAGAPVTANDATSAEETDSLNDSHASSVETTPYKRFFEQSNTARYVGGNSENLGNKNGKKSVSSLGYLRWLYFLYK